MYTRHSQNTQCLLNRIMRVSGGEWNESRHIIGVHVANEFILTIPAMLLGQVRGGASHTPSVQSPYRQLLFVLQKAPTGLPVPGLCVAVRLTHSEFESPNIPIVGVRGEMSDNEDVGIFMLVTVTVA
jgi:hypothetical protein